MVKKVFLLYIAMVMSAVSGVMVLMPMVYIHRIVNNLILNGMVNFDYVKENSISAAVFAVLGLFYIPNRFNFIPYFCI